MARIETLRNIAIDASTLRLELRRSAWRRNKAVGTANHERCDDELDDYCRVAQQMFFAVAVELPEVFAKLQFLDRDCQRLRSTKFSQWDDVESELRTIEAAAIQAEDSQPSAPVEEVKPKTYLQSWREILDALGQKNEESTRRLISRLNTVHDGPITIEGRGSQPFVERETLLKWWNSLEKRKAELDQRQVDMQATVSGQYAHGKTETVIPDISGSVKKRRKDRKT